MDKAEKLRKIIRKFYELKAKVFGLSDEYNIATDVSVPLDTDKDYVLRTIATDFPEYFTGIDWSSDMMDNFHPLSKNTFAFMAVYLKILKSHDQKAKLIRYYLKYVSKRNIAYVLHG